jgi:hypothetical protein
MRGARPSHQALQLGHVGTVGTDLDRSGQGDGNEAGVLAGEKEAHEIRVGLGDQGDTIALFQAHAQQFVGQVQGLLAQLSVAEAGVDGAAAGVEIGPGLTPGCVIQSFGKGGKIGGAKWEFVAGWRGDYL